MLLAATLDCVLDAGAARATARARVPAIIACAVLAAATRGVRAEALPQGLELLAQPTTSNTTTRLPADVTADASRLLIDLNLGSFVRAAIMDAAGVEVLALPAEAYSTASGLAISPDGTFVVGTSDRRNPTHSGDTYAILWRSGSPSVLPDLVPGGTSGAIDVSADGRVVVGGSSQSLAQWYKPTAVRWVDGAVEALPVPPGTDQSTALAVSDDGSVIVGTFAAGNPLVRRGARWRNGQFEELPPPPQAVPFFAPTRLNSDGSVVLGWQLSLESAVARLDESGWAVIEDLPTGPHRARLGSGSDDGRVVTGAATTGADPAECPGGLNCLELGEAFVWTDSTGTRRLKDLLVEGCGYPIEPWTLTNAWISRDARHVIFSASGPDLPEAYVRASLENCRFDYPEPDRRPKPGSSFASLYSDRAIFHIDPKGGIRLLASNAPILNVLDVELGPDRSLYVFGCCNQLARVGIDDGVKTLVASGGLMGSDFGSLAVARDGTPYVLANVMLPTFAYETRLVRIDPATGAQTLAAKFARPGSELEREPGGTLAVLLQDASTFELYRFDPSNGSATLRATGTTGGRSGIAAGLAVRRDGETFLGFDDVSIQRIDPTGIVRRITTGPMRHDSRVRDIDPSGAPLLWDLPGWYLVRTDPDTGTTSAGFGSIWFPSSGSQTSAVAVLRPECSDGFDNDHDGRFDYPEDRGCASPDDDEEGVRDDLAIDVEPFLPRNVVLLAGQRPIRVALLGSESVDASKVDLAGLRFGPAGAHPRERRAPLLDVNRDGFRDALLTFDLSATGIALGDTEACLTGQLEGDAFRACDEIEVVLTEGCGRGHALAFVVPAVAWLARRRRYSTGTRSFPSKGGAYTT